MIDQSGVILVTIPTWDFGSLLRKTATIAAKLAQAALADIKKVKLSRFLPCAGDAALRGYISQIAHPAVSVPNSILGAMGGELNLIQGALGQDNWLGRGFADMIAEHTALLRDGLNSWYRLRGGDAALNKAQEYAQRPKASPNLRAKNLAKFRSLSVLKTAGRRSAYVAAIAMVFDYGIDLKDCYGKSK